MMGYRRILGIVAIVSGFISPSLAQTAAPQPPASDIAHGKGTLSDKLGATSGVIHPDEGVDPGMGKTPPATGTMPVVPPPGAPGGRTDIDPK